MYVLDTNTLIYFFKGQGEVAKRLLAVKPGDIGIPTVVLFEMEFGLEKSTDSRKRREQLETFISLVQLLPFGAAEARASARIRVRLEEQGTPIGPFDLLIAGTAMAHRGTLVTRNQREFGRIAELELENWYQD